MKYDVIIIGAGLGGLTSAAVLAKKGKKVLMLEQHNTVGGAATVFKRHGINFEVGLHEMDFGDKYDMKNVIFKKLGIFEKVSLIRIPQTWSVKTETEQYTIPEGHTNIKNFLKTHFPQESQGIDRYFAGMKNAIRNNSKLPSDMNPIEFFISPFTSLIFAIGNILDQSNTGDRLDSYFRSSKIKHLMNANISYYGEDPYSLSWPYYAAAQYSYYHSAVFVKGGSQQLSNALADIIKENGGEIRLLADAVKLETRGNKVTGVTYVDRKTKEHITVSSKKVIANTAPENINKMVEPKFFEHRTQGLQPSISLCSVSIIFKKKIPDLYPDMPYSTFLFTDKMINDSLSSTADYYRSPFIGRDKTCVFVNYDAIDAGLVPEGDHRGFGVLATTSHIAEWEALSPDEYSNKKIEIAERLIELLDKNYPGLKEQVEYYEVSTPRTIKHYLKTPNGSPYGYKNQGYIWRRCGFKFWLPTRAPRRSSKIKNLYYTGVWGFPGGGFTGAMISGYIAATHILMSIPLRVILGMSLSVMSVTFIIVMMKKIFLNH